MKLQSKILIIVIPFVLLSLFGLGLWSFNEAKKSIYHSSYHYLSIVLESYTAETLHQNFQLLKEAKMDQVASYVESYKQDSINKAKSLAIVRGGHIFAINESGKLIFCTQDHNSANIESSWNEISKKIVAKNSTEIIEGYIDKKPYDEVYVAQFFKPWDWVIFYSIPDEDVSVLVNRIRMITLGVSLLCALLSSFLIFLFCKKYLLRPIAKLKDAAQSIADHENIETISVNSTDELGLLARSMETMSKAINLYKTEQKQTETTLIGKHEELQKSQLALKRHQDFLEQLVDERTFELKESEKRFKTMIEKSPLPMSISDQNQDIVFFNDKFTELFGYTLKDVSTAEKWWEIAYPDEKYRAKIQQAWMVAIQKAKENNTDIDMQEWDLTIKDRSIRSCEFYMVPLDDFSLIVMNDITKSKQAEIEKKKLESQLHQAQKMESIGTLAGGIAHDFNNIMAIIVGNTELALDDVPKWNSAHSSLEEIKTASLRAKNIVKQLLSFSRKTDQKLQPIQIGIVIKDALKFLRSTIPTTINIHRDIQTTDETILADPTQINQIIMNLCINASHAMERTGGELTITVEKVILDDTSAKGYPDLKSGDHVKIMVSDTGPGIGPKVIDQIFDPYFTTKKVGKGSGMGLAVVHGIVKNSGGAIAVDSSPGKGSEFRIFFPLTKEKPMVETKTAKDIPRGNETILFVDDEMSITKMVKRMFERLGYKVETSTTPQDALELFHSNPDHFDLVITDMTMPQMTGVKLSQKLMDIRKDIPIIVCSGHSALVDEEKAKDLGLAAYIMKPIDMQETAQTIRKVLDKT